MNQRLLILLIRINVIRVVQDRKPVRQASPKAMNKKRKYANKAANPTPGIIVRGIVSPGFQYYSI